MNEQNLNDRLDAIESDIEALKIRQRQNRRELDFNSAISLGFLGGFVLLVLIGIRVEFGASGLQASYSVPIDSLVSLLSLPVIAAGASAIAPVLGRWAEKGGRSNG